MEDKIGNVVFGVCGIVFKKFMVLILFSVMVLLLFYESECL